MLEIRIHGRGGQGGVTTAELLARAAIAEGKYGQAFPSFGPERRGAPVVAFCRVDEKQIRLRSQILAPDVVVVLDPGLLAILDPSKGLKKGGILILNTHKSADEVKKDHKFNCRLALVDAATIAKEVLRLPITNTAMLGAVVNATGVIDIDSLDEPLTERFGRIAEVNIKACRRAYKETKVVE